MAEASSLPSSNELASGGTPIRITGALPKLNGAVERANLTHTEEFYQVTPCSLEMKKPNRELRQWKRIYNTVRLVTLGSLTPPQFLQQFTSQRKE
jgi:putative transposase